MRLASRIGRGAGSLRVSRQLPVRHRRQEYEPDLPFCRSLRHSWALNEMSVAPRLREQNRIMYAISISGKNDRSGGLQTISVVWMPCLSRFRQLPKITPV